MIKPIAIYVTSEEYVEARIGVLPAIFNVLLLSPPLGTAHVIVLRPYPAETLQSLNFTHTATLSIVYLLGRKMPNYDGRSYWVNPEGPRLTEHPGSRRDPQEHLLPGLSIVVPVYQSSASLEILRQRINESLLPDTEFEVLLVDDGSEPYTWHCINEIALRDTRFHGVRLSRNFGQHSALVAGVRAARYEFTVTIDDDLQNPPEEIPKLLLRLQTENADVVYGVPPEMKQSLGRRLAGRITRSTLKNGLRIDSAPQMTSFRAFRTQLRDGFAGNLGTNVSLDALLTWAASRYDHVSVRHDPREFGTSTYSMKKLVRFAIDSMTGYSTLPLQLASVLGLVTALFGLIVLLLVTLRPLIQGSSIPGFPFLASIIAIFSGVQLLTLGVIGEYLARMHFRIMQKPTYVVAERTDDQTGHRGRES